MFALLQAKTTLISPDNLVTIGRDNTLNILHYVITITKKHILLTIKLEDIIMTYTINITAADPTEFIFGTGFLGETFSSKDELKAIWRKCIPKKDIITKLTFSSAETTAKIKAFGDKLAAKGENINLFSLAAIARKDKFNNIAIYYLHRGWIDNNGTFKFILERNNEVIPQYDKKLTTILSDLGIEL